MSEDVKAAASSTADGKSAATSTAEAPKYIPTEQLKGADRDRWLREGNAQFLDTEPSSEKPATSKPAADKGGKAAESGTANKGNQDKDKNWRALESARQAAEDKAKAAEEKAAKLERDLEEARKGSKPAADAKADPKPATETASAVKEPERPKRPRLTDFKTSAEYETAMDKYEEERDAFPAKLQAFRDAKANFERTQTSQQERRAKTLDAWQKLSKAGKDLYDDWDKTTIEGAKDLPIVENEPVEQFLRSLVLESDDGKETAAHLLYYFATNRPELDRILKLTVRQQNREMEALVDALNEELGKPPRETPKEEKPSAGGKWGGEPPKKSATKAPKPPAEVGGSATTGEDPVKAAVARRDFSAFKRNADERARQRFAQRGY